MIGGKLLNQEACFIEMASNLNDKDWLEKVTTAYKFYPHPNLTIEQFITWLYKQYGIVQRDVKK